jgi:hypothetical protein
MVRTTRAIISGKISFISKSIINTFFNAEIAWVGDINLWKEIGYPASVNSGLPSIGNAAPVKNINSNNGKFPTIKISLADLVKAARIKLNAIIEMHVKITMKAAMVNEPVKSNPSQTATFNVNTTEMTPTNTWIKLAPVRNSNAVILESLSLIMVLFSTSVMIAMEAENISMMTALLSKIGFSI